METALTSCKQKLRAILGLRGSIAVVSNDANRSRVDRIGVDFNTNRRHVSRPFCQKLDSICK